MSEDKLVEELWSCAKRNTAGFIYGAIGSQPEDYLVGKAAKRIRELEAELSKWKCPIGLEASHSICSAGTCFVCTQSLRNDWDAMEAELSTVREQCKTMQGLGAGQATSLALAEFEREVARNTLAITEAELSTARGEIATLKGINDDIQERLHIARSENEALREKLAAANVRIEELEAQRDHARGEVATLDYIRSSLATSIEQGKELGNVIARQANLVQTLRGTITVASETLKKTNHHLATLVNCSDEDDDGNQIPGVREAAKDQVLATRAALAQINQPTKDNTNV